MNNERDHNDKEIRKVKKGRRRKVTTTLQVNTPELLLAPRNPGNRDHQMGSSLEPMAYTLKFLLK